MLQLLSSDQWTVLTESSYIVNVQDRMLIKVLGVSQSYLTETLDDTLLNISPVLYGEVLRVVKQKIPSYPAKMAIHYFGVDLWCEVDASEINNPSVGEDNWTPILPRTTMDQSGRRARSLPGTIRVQKIPSRK